MSCKQHGMLFHTLMGSNQKYWLLVPKSSRIEFVNLQANAATALGGLERGSPYVEAGIKAARIQGYNLWASESHDVYRQMRNRWLNEPQVKTLTELFHQ